jgi:hypothetical protein
MKKLILSIAMITFIAGTVSVSFGQEPVKQSDKALDPMKMEKSIMVAPEQELVVTEIDSLADYQNLTKTAEVRFIENDKSIASLKLNNTTMDAMKKSAKTREINLLEQKNISLRKDLVSYKEEGKEEWKAFKKQFNTDMDKLTEDLKNMKTLATF